MPEIKKLSGLVEYQNGTIVSKTLINKKSGTVTLFAFDEGQALSEHAAPFDALVYILDGKADISISKKPYNLNAGETILMPANEPHAVSAQTRFKMLLVMIKS